MSEDTVKEFVAAYSREYDYYQAAARMCGQRCEALISPRGIRAIVTWRAKRPNKLLAKLVERDKEKLYGSHREIREDIADLAGVRIALYFPGDREIVKSILKENFTVEQEKNFPTQDKPKRAGKRFDGYYADHYRLYMQDESLEEVHKQYSTARIEVQVGSVLMHAWAEVEHDLVYKPESGELSQDEEAILDEVNGLVIAGEVALERLQRALQRRLGEKDVRFDSHYDLAAYLHRWSQGVRTGSATEMGRVDLLWELLEKAKLNTAAKLGGQIGDPSILSMDQPIADEIADIVLGKNPEMYGFYRELLTRSPFSIGLEKGPLVMYRNNAIGDFFSKWIILERTHAIHADIHEEGVSRNPGDMLRWVRKIELSSKAIDSIKEIRSTRNFLVHGIRIPGPKQLAEVTGLLDNVLNELEHHKLEDVREAFRQAQMPLLTGSDPMVVGVIH